MWVRYGYKSVTVCYKHISTLDGILQNLSNKILLYDESSYLFNNLQALSYVPVLDFIDSENLLALNHCFFQDLCNTNRIIIYP